MKIVYTDENEKNFYENGRFEECLNVKNSMRIVREGRDYFIRFTVTDDIKANAFIYDLLDSMNNTGRENAINTDFIGINVKEIGQGKPEFDTDKVAECIDILTKLIS